MRNNVAPTPHPQIIDENAQGALEYAIVIRIIEQKHYLYLKPKSSALQLNAIISV